MQNTTKKVDALGFDRSQIAAIKRAYASNKVTYKKMDAISAKIQALYNQYEALEKLTETWDAPAKGLSKEVLGIELTSREILAAHENPEAFYAQHPECAKDATRSDSGETSGDEEMLEPVSDSEPVPEEEVL